LSGPNDGAPLAVVFGCAGPRLGDDERRFFRDADPLGFILFERNCAAPDQVCALVGELRAAVGRDDAPVLIDQEGGRVVRLKPPHWRPLPAAARLAHVYQCDAARGVAAARLNARLIAAELHSLGITVDCAPVLDIPVFGSHPVIGDRALGTAPAAVAELGRAFCDGLLAGCVLPVIKHIPGHGRATVDSHHGLPTVAIGVAELERTDFAPFRALADMPVAMIAHVLYTALDPRHVGTVSADVICAAVRGAIGFDGLLVSDDLSMAALPGGLGERTAAALVAGCDVVLHCNADPEEMRVVAAAARPLTARALERLDRAQAMRAAPPAFDAAAGVAELERLLAVESEFR